jgi:hypothetical protein
MRKVQVIRILWLCQPWQREGYIQNSDQRQLADR